MSKRDRLLSKKKNKTDQLKKLAFPMAPSVSFADSSLPEGALDSKLLLHISIAVL